MEAITVDRSQTVSVSDTSDVSSKDERRKGTVTLRNYVMNDLGALRKKLKHEGRKHDFMISNEAKDCSNTVIQMKTSFFEFTKAKFIEEILQNDDIESVQNAEAAKAATETSGEAYVEFSMDITFKAKEKTHTVKVIAYTTTCQLMIQPKGEQSGVKAHLGSRGTPRYFADTFLIPWCQKSVESNAFNEKMSGFYLNALNNEIKRMEASKTELRNEMKKRAKHSVTGDITNAKCVNKGCSFKGLDPNNKSAVGVCNKCSNFEHFACIRMKPEHKDDIIKGSMKFYCSECFSKNPSIGSSKTRPRLDSLPILGQGYIFKVAKTVTATTTSEETPNKSKAITEVIVCDLCPYETNNQDDLTAHKEHDHSFKCDFCAVQAKSQGELEEHVSQHHIVPCNICDTRTIRTREELEIHIAACHSFPCNICSTTFTTTSLLTSHMTSNHSEIEEHITVQHESHCNVCNETFFDNNSLKEHQEASHEVHCNYCEAIYTSEAEKEKHIRYNHNFYCVTCETVFITKSEMEVHNKECHTTQISHECNICQETLTSEEKLREHIEEKHVKCPVCDEVFNDDEGQLLHIDTYHKKECSYCNLHFQTPIELEKHMIEKHSISCPICALQCKNIADFNAHFKQDHTHPCQVCDKEFGSSELLKKHTLENHTLVCNTCKEPFDTKTKLESHIAEAHICKCTYCDETFGNQGILNDHISGSHSFDCVKCNFKGKSIEMMEAHILDKHVHPDKTNMFTCDECPFKCKKKETLGRHFQDKHKGTKQPNALTDRANENEADDSRPNTEEELRALKNNFERLQSLFHDTQEEANKVKAEYEAKLIEANDKYRQVKAENEELREKVDILFKLGRSYINNKEECSKNTEKETSGVNAYANEAENEEIECIDVDEVNANDLQTWTQNRLRGFKRTTPAAAPIISQPTRSYSRNEGRPSPSPPPPTSLPPPPPSPRPSQPPSERAEPPGAGRKQYCHYFANQGRCTFEEKTGYKCKFSHEKAPMCRSGMSCTRNKCMFSHPNIGGMSNNKFLDKSKGFQPQLMNVWPMMNPWVNQNMFQQSNPWGVNRTMGNMRNH